MSKRLSGGEEFDSLIAPVKMLTRFISTWPFDEQDHATDKSIFRFRLFQIIHYAIILGLMFGLGIAVLMDGIRNWGAMEELTECTLIASSFLLCFFRVIIFLFQSKNVLIIVRDMRKDWATSSEEDRKVLRKNCGSSYKLAKFFISSVVFTIIAFMAMPALEIVVLGSEERNLPFRGYFGIDASQSPIYELLYALEVSGGAIGGATIAGVTSFNLVTIMHASAKFSVLQRHISLIKNDDERSKDLLRSCIQEHQKAIEFADRLEEVINKVALGQFLSSTGMVCFAGLQITSMLEDTGRLMKYSSFLNSAIFELFIFSFSGNELAVQSGGIANSGFNSDWVGSSFGKNLQIMMMRATKPSKITAAKFYDMSLESFSTVLSTSFSYFTTLRAVNEEG
ncbi:odorant receptor 4-like [Athalia rosae]|uniref:odorant receptor 4-like n=1 Tax=Athalia rosae TaxID=37344 RepID=UPI00203491AF|nr:odorant receptor 4-like [Athalia rosae]